MTSFSRTDDFRNAEFRGVDLSGAHIYESDLTDMVIRGSEVRRTDIDAPWLAEGENVLLVNGVDVVAFVEAELNRRFPGRDLQRATDPAGLRAAYAAVEGAWAPVLERAASLPSGSVDVSVAGEWSFSQTLRHLVLATDAWLLRGILEIKNPFHPLGQADPDLGDDLGSTIFRTDLPSYAEVLEVRAERVGMVRDFLATVTREELERTHPHPWGPQHQVPTVACLHTILHEEWEHLRFAVRDLDVVENTADDSTT